MALALVQHIDPAHPSMLAEILAKKTRMSVAEARDGMPLARDHVYVIPPNASLTLTGDVLRVGATRGGFINNPGLIDTLFGR